MCRTKDGKYIVKELSDGDHVTLMKHTKALLEVMLSGNTLMVKFYAHFKCEGKIFAGEIRFRSRFCRHISASAMENCLPFGVAWKLLFDLKGCRDDKTMMIDGKRVRKWNWQQTLTAAKIYKVPAVHKRCFSCLQCWYCCDIEACTCCCYPEERRMYYKGKTTAYTKDLLFTEDQATKFKSMLKSDAETFKKLGVMNCAYS